MLRRHLSISLVLGILLAAPASAQVPCFPLPFPPPGCCRPEPIDPPVPIVRLSMRVPACAAPGENLRYWILIDNCSPAPAYHVLVRNTLPANAKFVSADPQPQLDGNDLVWKLGTLCGGCCREICLVLAPLDKCDVKNCARVQFEHGQCVITHIKQTPPHPGVRPPGTPEPPEPPGPPQPPVRPIPDPKKDTTPPPPPPPPLQAELTLKITGPKEGVAGQPTQYSLTVANPGTAAAAELLIRADLKDFDYVPKSASDNGAFLMGEVAWTLDVLPAGQIRTFTLKVKAKAAGRFCISGEAAAKDSVSGAELQRARAAKCTDFSGEAGLHIEIVDRNDPIEVGGDTSYPIRVLNQGHVPITNIRIRAFVPDGMVLLQAGGPTGYSVQRERTPDGRLIIEFNPLPALEVGTEQLYEVRVQPRREGDFRFRAQLTANELPAGTVTEEESTTVFRDDGAPPPPPPGQL